MYKIKFFMVAELKENLLLDNTDSGGLKTNSSSLSVNTILEENQTLFLAKSIEQRYGLEFQLQNITNKEKEIIKREVLLRSIHQKNPEKITENIANNKQNYDLVCYLLYKAFSEYENNKIPLSINVNISDINHPNFINAVNTFSKRYSDVPKDFLTFEIIETEELPDDHVKRKEFFNNLRLLRSHGYKIALDDIGGRDKDGSLLYSNIDRINEFLKVGALDIAKLDMELVRELYLYSIGKNIDLSLCKNAFNVQNISNDKVIEYIGNSIKNLVNENEGLIIVAEGIEDEFWKTIDGKRQKTYDNIIVDDFMKFLTEKLHVTQFQGYALGKPQDPEKK